MNNNGFTSIVLILFLPFLLVLSLGGLWVVWFINEKHSLNNICHMGLLKAQSRLENGNSQLLQLNIPAMALILKKRNLDFTIATAPPPAKAAALAARRAVVIQQKILNKAQKSLIHTMNFMAYNELIELRRLMRKKVEEIQKSWRNHKSFPGIIEIKPVKSQIKIDVKDIAPTYKRDKKHESIQIFQAHWNIPIKRMLPLWLLKWVSIHETWTGHCFSHPHKGAFQWYSAIGKGNHF